MKNVIYKITNVITEMLYIGRATNFKVRKRRHLSMLRRNRHFNSHLQNSFNKHGTKAFIFEIIDSVRHAEELPWREQYWWGKYDFDNELYNISEDSFAPMLGRNHTKQTRERISDSMKGEKCYCYGIPKSQEIKQKISESQKGEKGWRFGNPNLDSAKQVAQIDKNTNEIIAVYESVREAERQTGLKRSGIYNVASKQIFTRKGKEYTYKTAHGYKWEYV